MDISRKKFVFLFIISGFVFLFLSNALFGTDARLFPPHGESFLVTKSETAWKNIGSTVIMPVKVVLVGPMMPYISLLRQDPDTPPPFFLLGFILYWAILALILHSFLIKVKTSNFRQ